MTHGIRIHWNWRAAIVLFVAMLGFSSAAGAQEESGIAEWLNLEAAEAGNLNELNDSWLRAADEGDVTAQYLVALKYGIARDYGQSANWARRAAEQGHAGAMVLLGVMYEEGHGVSGGQDALRAVFWLGQAVEQGDSDAQSQLFRIAEQGDAYAQTAVGIMYLDGHGVAQDSIVASSWFRRAAEQDSSAEARYRLGRMYENGTGVIRDYETAMFWYKRAGVHARARYRIGRLYENGLGVPQDYGLALDWYGQVLRVPISGYFDGPGSEWQLSANNVAQSRARAEAHFALGGIREDGRGVPRELDVALGNYEAAARRGHAEALAILRQFAEQGNPNAQYRLARMYANGRGVPEDPAGALDWYRRAGDRGHVEAQFDLAEMYADGDGVPVDAPAAAHWYRLAAEQGHGEAQFSLAEMHSNGLGVLKDPAEAARWYRFGANRGDAEAQFRLGQMYASGSGVPQDAAEAATWYSAAAVGRHADALSALNALAEAGSGEGLYRLGLMKKGGLGSVRPDAGEAWNLFERAAEQGHPGGQLETALKYRGWGNHQEAESWFRLAAEQGNARAQFFLGVMYEFGQGVRRNLRRAATWYESAAEQDHNSAQYNLGLFYLQGRGVRRDYVTAHVLFALSTLEGSWEQQQRAEESMTPDQIVEAERRASEWEAGNPF